MTSDANKPKLLQLTDNYEAWESRLEDVFYGKSWDKMYEASKPLVKQGQENDSEQEEEEVNERANVNDKARR